MFTSLMAFLLAAQAQAEPPLMFGDRSVEELCLFMVEGLVDSSKPSNTRAYLYRDMMRKAAGVDMAVDDRPTETAKMQRWWNAHQHQLKCNVTNSVVRDGHIMRLAVDRSQGEFIRDVVFRWKLDINYRDPKDGGTVLDWIDDQLVTNNYNTNHTFLLNRWKTMLETYGGKRAKDL